MSAIVAYVKIKVSRITIPVIVNIPAIKGRVITTYRACNIFIFLFQGNNNFGAAI
jgi:hypothetical protein